MQTATDLHALLETPQWTEVEEVRRFARCNALLHLCDAALDNPSPHHSARRRRIRAIRPRVKVAASQETLHRHDEIERLAQIRGATVPHLWGLLEHYVARDRVTLQTATISAG